VFNNTRDLPDAGWPAAEVPETVHRHPMAMPGTLGRLGLTDQEVDDIVSFLGTLTDGINPRGQDRDAKASTVPRSPQVPRSSLWGVLPRPPGCPGGPW